MRYSTISSVLKMSEQSPDIKDEDSEENDDFYDNLELFLATPTLKISTPTLSESFDLNSSSSNSLNNEMQILSNSSKEASLIPVEDDLLMADIDSCLNEVCMTATKLSNFLQRVVDDSKHVRIGPSVTRDE